VVYRGGLSGGLKARVVPVQESVSETPRRRRLMVRGLMWAAAVLILVWIFSRVDPSDIIIALKRTRPFTFAAAVLLFSCVTLILDSITHFWLFNRFNPRIDFLTTLRCRGETYLLLSLGFIYGQGGMAYSVSRRADKPLSEVTGSILFLMLNTLISLMVFPTIALVFFINETAAPEFRASKEWSIVVRWLVISWPLIVLHYLFWARRWDNPLRRRLKEGLSTAFDQARITDYAVALGLRLIQVVFWVGFTWLGLKAFMIDITVFDLMIIGPLVGLISAIPTPGRIGPGQAAWLLLFQHRADPAALVAFSLLWVVGINILRWIIGAMFLALPGGPSSMDEKPRARGGAGAHE
jgi:hypothetical protein